MQESQHGFRTRSGAVEDQSNVAWYSSSLAHSGGAEIAKPHLQDFCIDEVAVSCKTRNTPTDRNQRNCNVIK